MKRLPNCLLLLAAACAHGDPYSYQPPLAEGPFGSAIPTQYTLSPYSDYGPMWLPDGSGLIYSYYDYESGTSDRCLGQLPAAGGQLRDTRCFQGDFGDDSTIALTEPAPGPEGTVAWVEQHNLAGRVTPDFGFLVVGSMGDRSPMRRLQQFPNVITGNTHATAINLRWLSPTRLAYIGVDLTYFRACNGCKLDTVLIHHEIMLAGTDGSAPTALPNSDHTTSIWPTADSSGLYYSVEGDTRVFQRPLNGGASELVYDFGSLGVVRDISVAGNTLAAVVGDGVLVTVDLSGPTAVMFDTLLTRYGRPALSPDGQAMIVEGIRRDDASLNPDLWLFGSP
jgi:hypothetical protein